jgi:hypothetical protein
MTEKQKAPVADRISKEMAEVEYKRFVDMMDLDVDPEGMVDDDKVALVENKRIFCRAVRAGSLIVNDEGEPVFTPQRSQNTDPITFYEPDGAVISSTDQAREGAPVSAGFKMMAALTKTTAKRFSSMKQPDLKVCTAVLMLFMV